MANQTSVVAAAAATATPTNSTPIMTNAELDKMLSNITKNTGTNNTTSKPPNNTTSKPPDNNTDNSKSIENSSLLSQGLGSIANTFSNIKNKVSGNSTALSKNNKTESINNIIKKEKERENAERVSKNENSKGTSITNKKSSGDSTNKSQSESTDESIWMTLLKVVIMVIVLVVIYYVAKYLITSYQTSTSQSPYLLNGSKNGKHALVISQDPTNINYIPISKSEGQDGIQFTYGFWFIIADFSYKKGEWKHIFHKGNSSSYPNRAPGVWIHPDTNAVRVYMNTLDNILEYADIDNLPVRKWIYMNIILNNKNLDLYINGFLKIRKELSSLPKQNEDDFWVNMFGGFEGYVSNIRYYTRAIDFAEITNMIKAGPSINNCIDTGEIPPYLDDNWWFNYNG